MPLRKRSGVFFAEKLGFYETLLKTF